MGNFQNSESAAGLGVLTKACQANVLTDWRPYFEDGLFNLFPAYITEMGWQGRTIKALTGGGQFRKVHRLPAETETGGSRENCEPTTFTQDEFRQCEIKVPELELINIQLEKRHEQVWRNEFCTAYPRVRKTLNLFNRDGSRVEIKDDEDSGPNLLFAQWVAGQMYSVTGQHIKETALYGQKERVDEFDGYFSLIENGNTPVGDCDYPLKPARFDFGYLVTGLVGARVNPASVVPEFRPPVVLHEGTVREVSMPVAGKNLHEIMGEWKRNVVKSWGYRTNGWVVAVGLNQTDGLARLAACMRVCAGDYSPVIFTRPEAGVSTLAANLQNNKIVTFFPDPEEVPMIESNALEERGMMVMQPLFVVDPEDQQDISPFAIVFESNTDRMFEIFEAFDPAPIEQNYGFGFVDKDMTGLQQETMEVEMFYASALDSIVRMIETNENFCWGLAAAMKATMVMQVPETILVVDGVDYNTSPTITIQEELAREEIVASNATVAPGGGFGSAIDIDLAPMGQWQTSDTIYLQTAYGTTFVGTVRSYDNITGNAIVDFVEVGITHDTTAGGFEDGFARGTGSMTLLAKGVSNCVLNAPNIFDLSFPVSEILNAGVNGAVVRVTSSLKATVAYGTVTSIIGSGPGTAEVRVTLTAGTIPADCDWDVTDSGETIDLARGGLIEIVYVPV